MPVEEIPPDQHGEYTMGGAVPVVHWYLDERASSSPRMYPAGEIDALIERASRKGSGHYPETDPWVHEAMQRYVPGRRVLVVGSQIPWYEAMALYYRCAVPCSVVEHQPRECARTDLRYLQPSDLSRVVALDRERFDVVISISSIEHDGLGRYGDPLDANADLHSMRATASLLSPGGIIILSVPVGRDKLVWNAHRVYGRIRLPRLIEGYEVVECFGMTGIDDATRLDVDLPGTACFQPVIVLRAPSPDMKAGA
jgi:hypothetical protein